MVFGSIVNEGYLNNVQEGDEFCIYNRNPSACSYGVTVGVLAFLTCLLYLALDAYFPQISSVKDRKKAVLSDIGVSGEPAPHPDNPGPRTACRTPAVKGPAGPRQVVLSQGSPEPWFFQQRLWEMRLPLHPLKQTAKLFPAADPWAPTDPAAKRRSPGLSEGLC